MANVKFHLSVHGLDTMLVEFTQLATPEPIERAREDLNAVLRAGFGNTQAAVPTGTGDYRRPAGALRDSGRYSSEFEGDEWHGSISYGTNSDELPYAQWAMWKNVNKGKENYLYDPLEEMYGAFEEAVNAPFDDVFGRI